MRDHIGHPYAKHKGWYKILLASILQNMIIILYLSSENKYVSREQMLCFTNTYSIITLVPKRQAYMQGKIVARDKDLIAIGV